MVFDEQGVIFQNRFWNAADLGSSSFIRYPFCAESGKEMKLPEALFPLFQEPEKTAG